MPDASNLTRLTSNWGAGRPGGDSISPLVEEDVGATSAHLCLRDGFSTAVIVTVPLPIHRIMAEGCNYTIWHLLNSPSSVDIYLFQNLCILFLSFLNHRYWSAGVFWRQTQYMLSYWSSLLEGCRIQHFFFVFKVQCKIYTHLAPSY